MDKSKMEIKVYPVDALIESEYNPRKISRKEMDDLIDSITVFGLTEPIIINTHEDRAGVIISGHQRLKACKQLGMNEVPCLEMHLTLKEEKQLNIRMNKNGGKFDYDILGSFFNKEDLMDWGFIDADFPIVVDPDEKIKAIEDEPVYPIVPVLSEKYDYVIIYATNEIDIAYLDNFFDMEVEKSYKNSRVGIGRVVSFEKFKSKVRDERVG
jgi:hypothetical protein